MIIATRHQSLTKDDFNIQLKAPIPVATHELRARERTKAYKRVQTGVCIFHKAADRERLPRAQEQLPRCLKSCHLASKQPPQHPKRHPGTVSEQVHAHFPGPTRPRPKNPPRVVWPKKSLPHAPLMKKISVSGFHTKAWEAFAISVFLLWHWHCCG